METKHRKSTSSMFIIILAHIHTHTCLRQSIKAPHQTVYPADVVHVFAFVFVVHTRSSHPKTNTTHLQTTHKPPNDLYSKPQREKHSQCAKYVANFMPLSIVDYYLEPLTLLPFFRYVYIFITCSLYVMLIMFIFRNCLSEEYIFSCIALWQINYIGREYIYIYISCDPKRIFKLRIYLHYPCPPLSPLNESFTSFGWLITSHRHKTWADGIFERQINIYDEFVIYEYSMFNHFTLMLWRSLESRRAKCCMLR